mgnify:CR=1 FL=1
MCESGEDTSFLFWGGRPQQVYEYLRSNALNGVDIQLFEEWGMTLVVSEYYRNPLQFWTIKRVRAPVRAGEFALKELLFELGILSSSSQSEQEIQFMEACL